jgi:hypothetical protein
MDTKLGKLLHKRLNAVDWDRVSKSIADSYEQACIRHSAAKAVYIEPSKSDYILIPKRFYQDVFGPPKDRIVSSVALNIVQTAFAEEFEDILKNKDRF